MKVIALFFPVMNRRQSFSYKKLKPIIFQNDPRQLKKQSKTY